MGIKPLPTSSVSYDKFLPKFWTPEEDIHIQKIKLGSQRRPWYKKIQGFSVTVKSTFDQLLFESNVTTVAACCIFSSFFCSLIRFTRMHSPPLCPFLSFCLLCSPHVQPHTPPQHPKSPLLETPPLVFAPVDPTSGPRLVKGEKWMLLGRQDPREPPDPIDYESICPDLENDDMFARRTLAFQSNTNLAKLKTLLTCRHRRCTSEPQLNIVTQKPVRGGAEETEFPDIEQDDVVFRREKTQQAQQQRPLSGAPDNYAPMPIPEPWALPPDLKSRLLCPPCPLTHKAAIPNLNEVDKETRPETDDMLIRKFRISSQKTPSVPSSCSKEDLQKWQAIREASQLRHKKRLLVERLGFFFALQALSDWKSRRRSVNSDIVKKKEEREKIEQITYGGEKRSKTFKEMSNRLTAVVVFLLLISGDSAKKQEAPTVVSSSSSLPKVPEPSPALSGTQTEVKPLSSGPLHTQAQPSSMEPKPPAVSRVSSSLPKTYQRSDSTRLTSVVTPRPFGSQPSRITSLPRGFTTDDSHKRVNGNVDVSKKSSVPSRYHQFMTSEDEAQSSSAHSSEEEEEEATTGNSVNSAQSVTPVPPQVKSEPPAPENYCEMRISLNQKPNSSRDFGFQAAWDSTGACVTSIQPGSPAEMCQLQTGDKVLTVNGHKVADMSYTEWKSHMDEALQEGSLVMDIRRHGQNNWDRVQPSLPFKSHKTINLTSTDHPMLVGSQEKSTISSSLDFTSNTPAETLTFKETPQISTGCLRDYYLSIITSIWHKQADFKATKFSDSFVQLRGKFAMCGFLFCLQIPVPVITPSSRWSFDPEEERKRQEKWQKEQERLLQLGSLEVNNHSNSSTGPHSPLSPVNQPTSLLWEEEERKRKEEQERQRQAEEKRKREEEERELLRLQEQRMRKERQEQEERKRREDERRLLEAEELQRREKERAFEQQQQWSVEPLLILCCPEYSNSHKKDQQPASQAELERQQILNEMKKKTSLLTDNSWIRQRSPDTSTNKERDLPPMRRGDSLDNLDTSYNSWRSSSKPRSGSFAQNYFRPHSALSGSTSFYGGGPRAQRYGSTSTLPSSYSMGSLRSGAGSHLVPWSRQSSVSGKKICTFCETPLGKGAAMIIESLGLCYHLGCFKCIDCKSDLGGSEAGAEVRIRNKQLYCNSCYMRVKTGQPTSM
uniref:LIM domain 7a n=1 Tax=Maylandia zebra TaxID=106582 RepID=A0A3P9D4U6_9CICH